MHLLYTSLYTFPKMLVRRICLTIKSFFSWWSLDFRNYITQWQALNAFFKSTILLQLFYFQKITEEEGLTEWVHPERKREQKKKKKEDNPEGKKKKGNEKEKVSFFFISVINPLAPKIWLLILPSYCYTFPCKLVTGIWCQIKIKISTDKFEYSHYLFAG